MYFQSIIKKIVLPIAAIAFFIFICWIIIQADQGQSNIWVKKIRYLPSGDKFGHIVLYGILAMLVNLALNNRKVKLFSFSVLLGSLLVATFAILEEFTQIALSSRSFELLDIFSDLIGISLFSYLAIKLGRKINSTKIA